MNIWFMEHHFLVLNGSNTPNAYTIDKSQLSLFRLDKSLQVCFNDAGDRQWYWLRDVWSNSGFCNVNASGRSNFNHASNSGGVRPCFLIY